MEKIRQAITEIWVLKVWQPPAQPPTRTDDNPLQPRGLRGKKALSPVSEWVTKFNRLFGTADIGVHVVHKSGVIIAYT